MKFYSLLIISILVLTSCSSKKDIGMVRDFNKQSYSFYKHLDETKMILDQDIKSQIALYDSKVMETFYDFDKIKQELSNTKYKY